MKEERDAPRKAKAFSLAMAEGKRLKAEKAVAKLTADTASLQAWLSKVAGQRD